MDIPIVATGTANTASVAAWLLRAGLAPRITASPRDVIEAPALVLPGVGAFGAAMRQLSALGLVEPLRQRLRALRPTLCICLGMQLLLEASEESPGVEGLGVVPGSVRRLPPTARVPHMGWNSVTFATDARGARPRFPDGLAYFANSFALLEQPPGWETASTTHAVPFVSALARGGVLACQFHPELSSSFGERLLDRWRAAMQEPAPC